MASYNYLLRMPILSRFLHIIDAETEQKFSTLVDEIGKNHFLKVKLLSPAENMEKRSKMEMNRLSPEAFPVHDEKTQSAFYGAHVTAASQPILHPSLLYEGRLVRRSDKIEYTDLLTVHTHIHTYIHTYILTYIYNFAHKLV